MALPNFCDMPNRRQSLVALPRLAAPLPTGEKPGAAHPRANLLDTHLQTEIQLAGSTHAGQLVPRASNRLKVPTPTFAPSSIGARFGHCGGVLFKGFYERSKHLLQPDAPITGSLPRGAPSNPLKNGVPTNLAYRLNTGAIMKNASPSSDDRAFQGRAIEAAIRISLLALLVVWCFNIVKPFILPVLWGSIFAVALYPLFLKVQSLLGGREKLAAILMTLVALALLITPTVMLSRSLFEGSIALSEKIKAGTLTIPPPSEKVKDWPLVGRELDQSWSLASTNLDAALDKFKSQLEAVAKMLLSFAAGAGASVLQFVIAIMIAGALLVYARPGSQAVERIASRVMGAKGGKDLVNITGATIRSVAQGVLGVALIQSILAGIGLMAMGVPYAGVWALLVLLLAIIQLPTILILGPIIVYVFSVAETLPAVIFMIWSILVGVSDTFLKPLFLGRGMDIPMLVILLGAIGGMILSGIVGLFVGAVVLAVGYKLFNAWLAPDDEAVDEQRPTEN